MEENYVTSLGGVISSLQSLCRSESKTKRALCKREIKERLIMEEVARCNDKEFAAWKDKALDKAQDCFKDCRLYARDTITECNSTCLNPMIQEIWKNTNMAEFIGISEKYTN